MEYQNANASGNKSTWLNGFFENPILVLTLGLCPVIATSVTLKGALFMGICTLIVLFLSNVIVSSLRKVIGEKIRIVAYILIIATFVTVIKMLTQKFFPEIDRQIGLYISLIIVNCLILGRAESFARKNTVGKSAIDALSMGIGYTAVISLLGLIREIFGSNSLTLFGVSSVFGSGFVPLKILTTTAGAFFTLALIIMIINGIKLLSSRRKA